MDKVERNELLKDVNRYLQDFAARYADGLIDIAQGKADLEAMAGCEPTAKVTIYFHDNLVYEGIINDIQSDNELINDIVWDLAYSANGYVCEELIRRGCDVHEQPAGTFTVTVPVK